MNKTIPFDRYITSKNYLDYLMKDRGVNHIDYLKYKRNFDKMPEHIIVDFKREPAFEIGARVFLNDDSSPSHGIVLTYAFNRKLFSKKMVWNNRYLIAIKDHYQHDGILEVWCHETSLSKADNSSVVCFPNLESKA